MAAQGGRRSSQHRANELESNFSSDGMRGKRESRERPRTARSTSTTDHHTTLRNLLYKKCVHTSSHARVCQRERRARGRSRERCGARRKKQRTDAMRRPVMLLLALLATTAQVSGWTVHPIHKPASSRASASSTTAMRFSGTIQCRAPPAALAIGFLGGPLVGGLMTYLILGKLGLYQLAPLKDIGRLSLATAPEAHLGFRF